MVMKELEPHRWKLTLELREDTEHCEVVAHLGLDDRSLVGRGQSRRNPADPMMPKVGEELATARALQDLAQHLGEDAWRMIEEAGSGARSRS